MEYTIDNRPFLLEHFDNVLFAIEGEEPLLYEVVYNHLTNLGDGGNVAIFKLLKVDKYDFCTKAYGYETIDGDWPESEFEDYGALTRAVNAIYDLIEKPKKIKDLMVSQNSLHSIPKTTI
ncbi:MAG: hypothetical protein J5I47_08905 [Vicingus serpentipes]|nr:hypothetical protein [Vicingus serpentipes]